MGVIRRLFGRGGAAPADTGTAAPDAGTPEPSASEAGSESTPAAPGVSFHPATGDEHYVLRCKACNFEHHIPAVFSDADSQYSVSPDDVRITCLFGGFFAVSLQVDDFFDIASVPAGPRVLAASIAMNMNPLHEHMLTHWSPIFLVIEQGSNYTRHTYRKEPEGEAFVKFSREHGIDIVGKIDISKAEIPGVS